MPASSHTYEGAGSARAPLLGLVALGKATFWDAPFTP
jgi:hypothetical protein